MTKASSKSVRPPPPHPECGYKRYNALICARKSEIQDPPFELFLVCFVKTEYGFHNDIFFRFDRSYDLAFEYGQAEALFFLSSSLMQGIFISSCENPHDVFGHY